GDLLEGEALTLLQGGRRLRALEHLPGRTERLEIALDDGQLVLGLLEDRDEIVTPAAGARRRLVGGAAQLGRPRLDEAVRVTRPQQAGKAQPKIEDPDPVVLRR